MTDYYTNLLDEPDAPVIPTPGVDTPWESLEAPEAGLDPQAGAATTTEQWTTDPYGEYTGRVGQGFQYINQTKAPQMEGAAKSQWLKLVGSFAAQSGLSMGISALARGGGAYNASIAQSTAGGMGETAATETAKRQMAEQTGASRLGTAVNYGMSAYAGYTAAPLGAMYARESGDPSPYMAGNAESGLFQTLGGRSDKEASQAHGERTSMSAAGFVAGAVGGGWEGGIAGMFGAQFAENPYTGKRGYQEEWKYNIKPIGRGIGNDAQDLWHGRFPQKGGGLKNITNMKNYGKVVDLHPGSGPKPPPKSEIQRDIQYGMAKNVGLDYNIRSWWNEITENGGLAGREFVKTALQDEGRQYVDDPNLPDYMSGRWGSGDHPYDYRPQEINGRRVASKEYGNYLAALQTEYERMGSTRDFYNKYMENFNIYQEGGSGLSGQWHGKEIYNVPSEVSGMSFQELFPSLNVPDSFTEDYWDTPQVQEEEQIQ